jgi:hypothetical protein
LIDTTLIAGMLCYVIRYYQNVGISCLITHNNGEVMVSVGDWSGRTIDLIDTKDPLSLIATNFLQKHAKRLISISNAAGVKQAIYYFTFDADILTLVDIRLSLNKFLGPGMIRDVFGKVFDTQQILKVDSMTDQLLDQIKNKSGNYSNGVIIKPSRFRSIIIKDKPIPLYVEIQ